MKYTALSVHLFTGASEKDTEAATTTTRRDVSKVYNGEDTVAGPLPLYFI